MSDQELKTWKRSDHSSRKDLEGEHPLGDLGQIVFLFVFLAVWISDSFVFYFSTFLSADISIYLRLPFSVVLLLLSGYLAQTGLKIVFKEVRTPPCVIEKGVFNFIRHPVYLSALLLYMGLIILTLSLVSFGLFIIIILFYNYIAAFEEKFLGKRFGKEYVSYMKRVPKWIPCTFKTRKY